MMMVYKLTSIPDISLVKYKIMSGNGIDVLREWTDDFLRQWQKISAVYDIEINFIVKYSPENCDKDKLELYIVFKYETKNEILNSTTTFGGGIYSRTVKVYSFI